MLNLVLVIRNIKYNLRKIALLELCIPIIEGNISQTENIVLREKERFNYLEKELKMLLGWKIAIRFQTDNYRII